MAFFGLTALGPQEQFKAARLEAYTCELVELKEFAAAFDAVSPAGAPLPAAKLDEVFRRVFHGPLPAPEADKVARHFRARGLALSAEAEVPRLAFMQAVEALREAEAAAPFDVGEAAHYTSSEMLREHRLRQIRPQTGPEQIYTKSREWGWPGPAAADGGGARRRRRRPLRRCRRWVAPLRGSVRARPAAAASPHAPPFGTHKLTRSATRRSAPLSQSRPSTRSGGAATSSPSDTCASRRRPAPRPSFSARWPRRDLSEARRVQPFIAPLRAPRAPNALTDEDLRDGDVHELDDVACSADDGEADGHGRGDLDEVLVGPRAARHEARRVAEEVVQRVDDVLLQVAAARGREGGRTGGRREGAGRGAAAGEGGAR